MPDYRFETAVLEQLAAIQQELRLLSQAFARQSNKENTSMAVTQDQIDALTQRVAAEGAVEDAALNEIKADFAAFQNANPDLDISALEAQVTAAEQRAAQEQQVGDENQPPAPTA